MLHSLSDRLRPYQADILRTILHSVCENLGLTFSVEIARQGGKNEISAFLEMLLLAGNFDQPKNLIKCAPTFRPQTLISLRRLKDLLNQCGLNTLWNSETGNIISLGDARAIFLSADETANVVGNTAHLLLEVDEAQDVGIEKFNKEFKPMGSTTNVTTVLYGTAWDESTLLEQVKQTNLELERKDGVRRHFRYDWQEVAKYNPAYLAYVETEKNRLGEAHPLFLTQYCLQPIHGGGGFLNDLHRLQLQGSHPRLRYPEPGKLYIAGIDLAGQAETAPDDYLRAIDSRQDATVVSIGELDFSVCDALQPLPLVKLVEHYCWKGRKHAELHGQLVDILRKVWHCRRIVVDATGIGQPVASVLRHVLGTKVIPFTFTAPSKSELGFNLLAAINTGRLKMYQSDDSATYREFWREMEQAKSYVRPSQTLNFFVDPADGHDDFLMSLALLLEAANHYEVREAKGTG